MLFITAPYVPCYTIPNSIALTVAQLIQHLESVPVAKEGNPPQVMRMFLWPHLCTVGHLNLIISSRNNAANHCCH